MVVGRENGEAGIEVETSHGFAPAQHQAEKMSGVTSSVGPFAWSDVTPE